jgi:hypothetical protein
MDGRVRPQMPLTRERVFEVEEDEREWEETRRDGMPRKGCSQVVRLKGKKERKGNDVRRRD